jgi:hypothetical protein
LRRWHSYLDYVATVARQVGPVESTMPVPTNHWRSVVQVYCLKCRAHREIKNAQSVTLKNGRPATRGTCPVCTKTVFRIGKA